MGIRKAHVSDEVQE